MPYYFNREFNRKVDNQALVTQRGDTEVPKGHDAEGSYHTEVGK